MSDIKIGVINWDGCLESNSTYFGSYCAKTLSDEKYVNRVPFYADITNGKVSFHKRTQEEFDTEMQYAIEAGIDYFAYVWYTERDNFAPDENVSETAKHVHELTYIRKLHINSTLNTKLKMCAILSAHPITDGELYNLALTMQKPYYQYIEDRPIVYIYAGYNKELISRLNDTCKKAGTPKPYSVIFTNNNPADKNETYEIADAVSAYCIPTEFSDCHGTDDFCKETVRLNELMLSYNIDVIPMYSAGWNPSPRIDTPVPWYGYANKVYSSPSEPEHIEAVARYLSGWLKSKNITPKHILSYAWNEFEEGGFICPTFTKNGNIDKSRISSFKKAIDLFHKTFEK